MSTTCPINLGMDEKLTIKQLMATANLTQQQLADLMGVKQSTVAGMLNPKGNPSLRTLRKLSRLLGTDIATLAATYHDPDTTGIPDDCGGDEN
jgi:transcriptional regulator with XRE-family HTH domain